MLTDDWLDAALSYPGLSGAVSQIEPLIGPDFLCREAFAAKLEYDIQAQTGGYESSRWLAFDCLRVEFDGQASS